MLASRQVYMYMHPPAPRPSGSGSEIRRYTTIRAYLDLGFDVEVVYLAPVPPASESDVLDADLTFVPTSASVPFVKRIAYQLGWPFEYVLDYSFPSRQLVRREVSHREGASPGAIHHFESLSTACAAINLPGVNTIFGVPDIESKRNIIVARMRNAMGKPQKIRRRRLRVRNLQHADEMAARQSRLVLCIAKHESEFIRHEWNCNHVELFPMSWPHEEPVPRLRPWLENGKLRLLHLGTIDKLVGFHSLKFLLGEVLPGLGDEVRSRIELDVVGESPDTPAARTILEMAEPFPQVQFRGFQKEIDPYYASADLQVVGTPVATGLRTRIIESFVYGLPVLSTVTGAEGVTGLKPDENILLARGAEAYIVHLSSLLDAPERLPVLAEAGRRTYKEHYSRQVAATKLGDFLNTYMQ